MLAVWVGGAALQATKKVRLIPAPPDTPGTKAETTRYELIAP